MSLAHDNSAFLFGLIVPRGTHLFEMCEDKMGDFVMTIMLPLYFALSGLKTDVTQLSTGVDGAMIVLVCLVATVGKLVGAGIPSLAGGLSMRESSVVAVLMNTRGLVELIVLNLGLQSGVMVSLHIVVMRACQLS
jgi:Kef-type K+ transport system membrane component KefB